MSQNLIIAWIGAKFALPLLLVCGVLSILEALAIATRSRPTPICMLDGMLVFVLLLLRHDILNRLAESIGVDTKLLTAWTLPAVATALLPLLRVWRVLDLILLIDGESRATESALTSQVRSSS